MKKMAIVKTAIFTTIMVVGLILSEVVVRPEPAGNMGDDNPGCYIERAYTEEG